MDRLRMLVWVAVPVGVLLALAFAFWPRPEPNREPEPSLELALGVPPAKEPPPDALLAKVGSDRFRHEGMVNRVLYRPDGKAVAATAENDPEVREWDAATGRKLHRYTDPQNKARGIAMLGYTPDSRRLIAQIRHEYDWIITFDTTTGEVVSRIRFFSNAVRLTPDGMGVIGRSTEKRLTHWNVETGRVVREYPTDVYDSIQYSPDGRWIAVTLASEAIGNVGNAGGILYRSRGWVGPVNGGPGHVITLPEPIGGVGVHLAWAKPDRVFLGTGVQMATFDPATGDVVVLAPPPKQGLRQVWVSDGQLFIQEFNGRPGGVQYDPTTLNPAPNGRVKEEPGIARAKSPDGRIVAHAVGNRIHLRDAETVPLPPDIDGLTASPYLIRFSADGRRMLTSSYTELCVWDINERTLRQRLTRVNTALSDPHLSPDGKWLVGTDSSSDDRSLVVWNAETGEAVYHQAPREPKAPRWHLLLGFDARGGIWARTGASFIRYDVPTGRELQTIKGFDQATDAELSSGGKFLMTGGWTTFAFRRTDEDAEWQVVARYPGRHQGGCGLDRPPSPEPIEFSRDGRKLLTGAGWWDDKGLQWKARVWDVTGTPKSGEWLEVGQKPAFTPDGQYIAALDSKKSERTRFIRVSNATTGAEVFRFDPRGDVATFAFTPDGKRLVVAHTDTTLTLWNWAQIERENLNR